MKASSWTLALDLAHRFRRALGRRFAHREKRRQIERPGEHRQVAVGSARPLLPWPVAVKLDAVVVQIARIWRLADPVIGSAFKRNVCRDQAPQRVVKRCVSDREMIEPRRTPRRGRTAAAFPGIKSDAMMIGRQPK